MNVVLALLSKVCQKLTCNFLKIIEDFESEKGFVVFRQ